MLTHQNKNGLIVDLAKVQNNDIQDCFRDNRGNFLVEIPAHISDNRDKRIYKVGFLNELYERLYPDMKRKKVFEEICDKYQIFINERQFQDDVKTFKEKKYVTFIAQNPENVSSAD